MQIRALPFLAVHRLELESAASEVVSCLPAGLPVVLGLASPKTRPRLAPKTGNCLGRRLTHLAHKHTHSLSASRIPLQTKGHAHRHRHGHGHKDALAGGLIPTSLRLPKHFKSKSKGNAKDRELGAENRNRNKNKSLRSWKLET